MEIAALSFAAGAALFQFQTGLPPAGFIPLLLLAMVPLLLRPAGRRGVIVAGFVAGFGWTWLHAALTLSSTLPGHLEGEDVVLEGTIHSVPRMDGGRIRFQFASELLQHDSAALPPPGIVRLSWYGEHPPLRVGERWRLTVRLKQPHGFMNPGGFDYEGWLFRHRIRATGYVRASEDNRRLMSASGYPVQGVRQSLGEAIDGALAGRPHAALVKALAIGDRQGITGEQWQVLRRTGTTHLMAISGLHVGMVAALIFFLVRRLWGFRERGALALAAPRAAALAAIAAATLYAALAGFSVPTQRALVMVAVVTGAIALCRQVVSRRVLATALLLVLLIDPLAVLDAGFWLSFGAVAAILYGMGGRSGMRGWWWRWGRVQVVVGLALAPLLILLFQEAAPLAPLANLIAVPLVGMVVVPLTLIGALLLGLKLELSVWLLKGAALLLEWLWPLLSWLAEALPAGWGVAAPPVWTLIAATIGVLWLLAPRGWPARWVGVIWLLPMLLLRPPAPTPGELRLAVLDVGQGLAVVIETRDRVLLYDTGPRFSASFDAGEAVVVPYLRSRGIARIDTLVVGHADGDHAGGLGSVLAAFPVERLVTGTPDELEMPAEFCRRGDGWEWGGVRFEFLHPIAADAAGRNDLSCVLMVHAPGGNVLLPGDIEAASERELVALYGGVLDAAVVVVPHHGSLTSSTAPFVDTVRPQYALFSVGYRNRHRFPRPEVVARYRAVGSRMAETAAGGALILHFKPGEPPRLERYRDHARRYWHAPPTRPENN